MTKVKIKCPNCDYNGIANKGGKIGTMLMVFGLSLMLFPIGLIFPIVYYHNTKNPKCPRCGYKFVIQKNENNKKENK